MRKTRRPRPGERSKTECVHSIREAGAGSLPLNGPQSTTGSKCQHEGRLAPGCGPKTQRTPERNFSVISLLSLITQVLVMMPSSEIILSLKMLKANSRDTNKELINHTEREIFKNWTKEMGPF